MAEIRTARTLGVTQQMNPDDVHTLADLSRHPGYGVLLDVLEQACIEQETRMLNRDVADHAGILAEHQKSQAAWQIFEHFQRRLFAAAQIDGEQRERERMTAAALSAEEQYDAELLNPLYHHPIERPR